MARYVGFKMGKVHESHTVSDYYCGRCGYPVTDHDSYCPECGGAFRECDADCLEAEVRNLKAENARLREIVEDWYPHMLKRVGPDALAQWGHIETMVELGVDIYPLNKPELRESEG